MTKKTPSDANAVTLKEKMEVEFEYEGRTQRGVFQYLLEKDDTIVAVVSQSRRYTDQIPQYEFDGRLVSGFWRLLYLDPKELSYG